LAAVDWVSVTPIVAEELFAVVVAGQEGEAGQVGAQLGGAVTLSALKRRMGPRAERDRARHATG